MRTRSDMMPLVASEIVRETPQVVSVRLETPERSVLPAWTPGAHIDVQLVTRQERQYSLCGDPADTRGYRIAVRNEPLSRGGSHYIHNFLRAGRRVYVRPPRNLFPLVEAPSYLLLAAGIGITPILTMARHLATNGADWRLIYLVRHPEDMVFEAELDALGERARVHVSSIEGRLGLRALLSAVPAGTDVYACGPQGFADALTDARGRLPEGSRLHMERFEPRPREFRPNEPFSVVCSRSDVTVAVPPERTVLQALQAAGIDVQGSCLRGICGSCAVTVQDGTPEHRDSLTADEGSSVMYPCVSRSLSPALVIDV